MATFNSLSELSFKQFDGFGADAPKPVCNLCGTPIPGVKANAFITSIALDKSHQWTVYACSEVCRDDMQGKGPTTTGRVLGYFMREIAERKEIIKKGFKR